MQPYSNSPPETSGPPLPSRRKVLKVAGAVGGAGLALGAGGFTVSRLLDWRHDEDPRISERQPLPVTTNPDAKDGGMVLVAVFLQGGNDGLNTVIPPDGKYKDFRPELSKETANPLPIDNGLALHPKLTRLKALYDEKRLAVVENVGYDKPNLSHFASTDIWMTCDPQGATGSGWVGRWLDAVDSKGHDPLRALAVGFQVPRYMRGDKTSAAAVQGTSPSAIPLLEGPSGQAYSALAGIPDAYHQLSGVQGNARDLLAVRSSLAQHQNNGAPAAGGAAPTPGAAGQLGPQLDDIAALIKSGLPTRVYGAVLGGFDTHAREEGTHEALMSEVDTAIGGLFDALKGSPYADQVVVMTFSEFGRRAAENGSGGSDHGAGSVLFVAGTPVKGGVYGGIPDLKNLDSNGDIKAAVDFRQVYAEVTEKALGADANEVVGKGFALVGFMS